MRCNSSRPGGVSVFSMEMIPRITRAQSMDALSSMATLAGYKAALLAAAALPKMFPMMMTAAGTLLPARALILGVGVAGLQAIAASRRMGAVVEAYDVRPDVKDQVQSLGAKFLDLPLETSGAQDAGGYAKAFDESFYRRQRELLTAALARQDVVISTAAVPGRKAPILVTKAMVEGMQSGSVIVDLAAERGGQLRADALGRNRGSSRCDDSGARQSAVDRPVSRQPDVRQERRQPARAPGQRGEVATRHGRRNHARDVGRARRRNRPPQGARSA